MLLRNILCLLFVFALGSTSAFAQNAYTPAADSTEGAGILKALGVPVSRDLKQPVTFATEKFKVQGNWAFVSGKARNATGGDPNWKITKHQTLIASNDFEDNLFALLKQTNGTWRVVTYMINCHDVCYLGWDKRYKAPAVIFE